MPSSNIPSGQGHSLRWTYARRHLHPGRKATLATRKSSISLPRPLGQTRSCSLQHLLRHSIPPCRSRQDFNCPIGTPSCGRAYEPLSCGWFKGIAKAGTATQSGYRLGSAWGANLAINQEDPTTQYFVCLAAIRLLVASRGHPSCFCLQPRLPALGISRWQPFFIRAGTRTESPESRPARFGEAETPPASPADTARLGGRTEI